MGLPTETVSLLMDTIEFKLEYETLNSKSEKFLNMWWRKYKLFKAS